MIVKPLASLMALWRTRAGVLLSGLLALDALIFVYAKTGGAHTGIVGVFWSASTSSTGFLLVVCAVEGFLVWRGGSVAWSLLLYLIGLNAVKTLIAVVSSLGPYQVGLLVLLVAQLTLLISPAVREHRPGMPVTPSR
jgi:hypothetical protein